MPVFEEDLPDIDTRGIRPVQAVGADNTAAININAAANFVSALGQYRTGEVRRAEQKAEQGITKELTDAFLDANQIILEDPSQRTKVQSELHAKVKELAAVNPGATATIYAGLSKTFGYNPIGSVFDDAEDMYDAQQKRIEEARDQLASVGIDPNLPPEVAQQVAGNIQATEFAVKTNSQRAPVLARKVGQDQLAGIFRLAASEEALQGPAAVDSLSKRGYANPHIQLAGAMRKIRGGAQLQPQELGQAKIALANVRDGAIANYRDQLLRSTQGNIEPEAIKKAEEGFLQAFNEFEDTLLNNTKGAAGAAIVEFTDKMIKASENDFFLQNPEFMNQINVLGKLPDSVAGTILTGGAQAKLTEGFNSMVNGVNKLYNQEAKAEDLSTEERREVTKNTYKGFKNLFHRYANNPDSVDDRARRGMVKHLQAGVLATRESLQELNTFVDEAIMVPNATRFINDQLALGGESAAQLKSSLVEVQNKLASEALTALSSMPENAVVYDAANDKLLVNREAFLTDQDYADAAARQVPTEASQRNLNRGGTLEFVNDGDAYLDQLVEARSRGAKEVIKTIDRVGALASVGGSDQAVLQGFIANGRVGSSDGLSPQKLIAVDSKAAESRARDGNKLVPEFVHKFEQTSSTIFDYYDEQVNKAAGGYSEQFNKAAEVAGVSPSFVVTTAKIESNLNPNAEAKSSSAAGLFQFTAGTAKQYGLKDPKDPQAASEAFAKLTKDNMKVLTRKLGRKPTEPELYLAHQQGAGGASKLLSRPSDRAVDVVGMKAVENNLTAKQKESLDWQNMTAQEFANLWINKFKDAMI